MIKSIIGQTIGFENVQLILVIIGDRLTEICNRYEQRYPDNIVVVHKDNVSISSARNEGLKYVKGNMLILSILMVYWRKMHSKQCTST